MNKLLRNAFLFGGVILVLTIAGYYLNEQVYQKVGLIHDKHEVLQKVSDSLPVQATIFHRKWGTLQVDDEVSLHAFVSYVDRIKQQYEPKQIRTERDEGQAMFSGRIRYLNGNEQTFSLENTFTLGKWSYGPGHETPMLSAMQTQLLSLFYTPEHYAEFIRTSKELTYRIDGVQGSMQDREKGYLVSHIRQASEMKDLVEIKQLLLRKQKPLGSITAFKQDNEMLNERNNLLHMVVYADYVVMEYMGDDNGNSIYLRTELETLLHGMKIGAQSR
ncbi:DUF3919 family protein [Paenibacillus sp. DMB20]|uniref:DUF3919 family protein n=1 Tax=Paenibacillus sp. DMB20 TaxID=1642570 RepID=UPI000627CB2A|nr:DUF3919 family protein [Paenibacillus sp. DMB20]KKO52250.1 cysteine synthase [Paenibacillus sp. DMB20]